MSKQNIPIPSASAPSLRALAQKAIATLVGFGTVGEGFYKLLELSGFQDIHIKHIVVQDKHKLRSLPADKFEYDISKAITDPDVELVIEVISDADAAFEVVKTALLAGKSVITANKKMLALNLGFLKKLQQGSSKALLYEAAICGSIPVLDMLNNYLGHEQPTRVEGVFNGTSNFILTEMEKGTTYSNALRTAQELGLAEADPSSDVEGWDTKYKLILAVAHSFGIIPQLADILHAGIQHIALTDLAFADSLGLKIRLKATGSREGGTVLPTFVEDSDPAFGLQGEDNCVQIQTKWAGAQRLFGPGAGGLATATAVLGDVKRYLEGKQYGWRTPADAPDFNTSKSNWYYVRGAQLSKTSFKQYNTLGLSGRPGFLVKAPLRALTALQDVFVAAIPSWVVEDLLQSEHIPLHTEYSV